MSSLLLVAVDEDLSSRIATLGGHRVRSVEGEKIAHLGEILAGPERPDALVLGQELPLDSALAFVTSVTSRFPDVDVILVREHESVIALAAMRAGVRDIVPPDADTALLAEALGRARSYPATPPVDGGPAQDGRIVVVTSPKGGVGKTTVATNTALALAQDSPGQVVLVDLDLQFGDVDTLLNISPERTVADVFDGSGSFDSLVLKTFLSSHESGLSLLCGAPSPDVADRIKGSDVARLLEELSHQFRHVVVDTSAGITEWTLAALEKATHLVLLSSMDVACIRGMRKEVEVLAELGLLPPARTLVLNMADRDSGIKVRDVEGVVGLPVEHVLPRLKEVPLAGNQGEPMVLNRRKSAFTKGVRSIVASVLASERARTHRRLEVA